MLSETNPRYVVFMIFEVHGIGRCPEIGQPVVNIYRPVGNIYTNTCIYILYIVSIVSTTSIYSGPSVGERLG